MTRLALAFRARIVAASVCLVGLTCASPRESPEELRGDPEALAIYTDLSVADFLPARPPRPGETPLSRPVSRIWLSLRALAAASPEERPQARQRLSEALATTGYTAEVCFRTPAPGAKVVVRSISSARSVTIGYTNSPDAYALTLGLYDVWTTRNGVVTDRREDQPVTRRTLVIDLEGDASEVPRCR